MERLRLLGVVIAGDAHTNREARLMGCCDFRHRYAVTKDSAVNWEMNIGWILILPNMVFPPKYNIISNRR